MIISIINHKGGVGKTTSAVSIGAGLHKLGKKVLLVDLDPQANLTVHFALETELPGNIYEALTGKNKLDIQTVAGIDIITSTLDLSAAEIELNNEPGREYLLREILAKNGKKYDYILIDCPPALGVLTINALSCSDKVIIPIEPSKFAISGMTKLFSIIERVQTRLNKKLKDVTLLITKVDSRKVIHRDIITEIRKYYKDKVFKTQIRMNVSLEEAQMQGKDIFSAAPTSPGADDYLSVCKEIEKQK